MHARLSKSSRALATAVGAALLVAFTALPALAHTRLLDSTPAEGDTVTEPAQVTLTFNEALIVEGTAMVVTDAAGVSTPLEPTFPTPDVVAAELPDLANGVASVAWRVVSADGHPVEGVVTFTVDNPEPVVTPSSTVEPTSSPEPSVSASPVVTTHVTVSPEPGADGAGAGFGGGIPAWLWAALIVVVVGGAVYGVVTVRRG